VHSSYNEFLDQQEVALSLGTGRQNQLPGKSVMRFPCTKTPARPPLWFPTQYSETEKCIRIASKQKVPTKCYSLLQYNKDKELHNSLSTPKVTERGTSRMTGHTDRKMHMKHAEKYSFENTIKRSKGRWKDPLFRLVTKKKSFDKSRDFLSLITLTLKSICNIELSPS
jgi:hypothetical protein